MASFGMRARHGVSTLATTIGLMVWACSPAREQRTCGRGVVCLASVEVQWAPGMKTDSFAERRLGEVTRRASQTIFMDSLDLGVEPITVTIVSELRGSDAMTLEDERRILIPIAWLAQPQKELSELVTHELTHVAVARIPGFRRIPFWFREGLAEFAAGRVGCQTSMELGGLQALGYKLKRALHDTAGPPSALQYKAYGSFTAFVIERSRVGLPALLKGIAKDGADSEFQRATGLGTDQLEERWSAALQMRDSNSSCSG
jgi:hypothetical protein